MCASGKSVMTEAHDSASLYDLACIAFLKCLQMDGAEEGGAGDIETDDTDE